MSRKAIELFQYFQFSFGSFLLLLGFARGDYLVVFLGVFIAVLALGTVHHLVTGRHNRFSKFPADYKK